MQQTSISEGLDFTGRKLFIVFFYSGWKTRRNPLPSTALHSVVMSQKNYVPILSVFYKTRPYSFVVDSQFQNFLFSLWNPFRKHSEFSAFYAPSSLSPTTTKFFSTSSKPHPSIVPSEWPSSLPGIWLGVGERGDSALQAPGGFIWS